MSDALTPEQRALLAIRKLRAEVAAMKAAASEPIAVVALACRFPGGADSPDAFWNNLARGVDAASPVPASRWDNDAYFDPHSSSPRKSYIAGANFVDGIEAFDARFFGISAREAVTIDPQQRLLLEATSEALDAAGWTPSANDATGVFLGISAIDYAHIGLRDLPDAYVSYLHTGSAAYSCANRLSFTFGLRGPSFIVDAACASSLIAIDSACQSLRSGYCTMAIAGGANVMLLPEEMVLFSQNKACSPDGRSRAFDARANGYGRGEGCGVVILKRLSDAQRSRDPIVAVIRGSASNHGGHVSGFTVPNVTAQAALIASALERSGLTAADVQYVEAHGTGTVLGDPIEVQALSEVYGKGHSPEYPLAIGSVKTNIGHLEATAGVAGLIRAILAIRAAAIPPSLHFKTPNPHIPWREIPIRVQSELGPWPAPDRPRVAGVSSFGVGGANAHVIVAAPPPEEPGAWADADAAAAQDAPLLLAISARTEPALRAYVRKYVDYLEGPRDGRITHRDISYTTTARRRHYEHRVAVVGRNASEWSSRLRGYLDGASRPELAVGNAERGVGSFAFVFAGQGTKWSPRLAELLDEPLFRAAVEEADAALRPHASWSIVDELRRPDLSDRLSDTAVAQPLLCAIQLGLVAVYRGWGIEPHAVMGHSAGEIAAACVAGVLDVRSAMHLAGVRGKIMQETKGQGRMLAAAVSHQDAKKLVEELGQGLGIAAFNGPQSVVFSGPTAIVEEANARLEKSGARVKLLPGEYAFHSAQMTAAAKSLGSALSGLAPAKPRVLIRSTLTGKDGAFDAAYWSRHCLEPVRFADAAQRLIEEGFDVFLEITPHPALLSPLDEISSALGKQVSVAASLRAESAPRDSLLASVGALHTFGCPLEFPKMWTTPGRVASLPSYPWQRERYWLPKAKRRAATTRPLVHRRFDASDDPHKHVFELDLDLEDTSLAYIGEHKYARDVWFPAAGYVELAFQCAREALGARATELAELAFREALVIRDPVVVQTVIRRTSELSYDLTISSRPVDEPETPWTLHATGKVLLDTTRPHLDVPLDALRGMAADASADWLYRLFDGRGFDLGPTFHTLEKVARRDGSSLARIRESELTTVGPGGFVHPAVVDASLQLTAAIAADSEPSVPVRIDRVWLAPNVVHPTWGYAVSSTDPQPIVTTCLLDAEGAPTLIVKGLVGQVLQRASTSSDYYEVVWRKATRAAAKAAPTALVFSDADLGPSLASQLSKAGTTVVVVRRGERFARVDDRTFVVNPDARADFDALFAALPAPPSVVVQLWPLEASPGVDGTGPATETALAGTLHLVHALTAGGASNSPRLFLITRGAQPALKSADVTHPEQAVFWGFGGAIANEHPELAVTLVDLDERANAEALVAELTAADDENRVAIRGADRYVQRIDRAHTKPVDPPQIDPARTYLVTGGYGGLGLIAAKQLVVLGAKHIALIGRSSPSGETLSVLADMRAKGVVVHALRGDVGDAGSLKAALAELSRADAPPIAGVLHAAGLVDDATLATLTSDRIGPVLRPKVHGTWNLHTALAKEPLDFFILYASAVGVLGGAGQSTYAAANAFLDAFAHYRRAQGKFALSVDWGAWADVGMAARSDRTANAARLGFELMSPDRGIGLLLGSMVQDAAQLLAFGQWNPVPTPANARLFELLTGGQKSSGEPILERIASATGAQRLTILTDYVISLLSRITGSPTSAFSSTTRFSNVGIDSLMVVTLRNALRDELKVTVTASMIYAQATPQNLAAWLLERVKLSESTSPESATTTRKSVRPEADAAPRSTPSTPETSADLELEELRKMGFTG